jgi:hypothetical protein
MTTETRLTPQTGADGQILDRTTDAVVRVGNGRGFVLKNPHKVGWATGLGCVVVTAAHCLPRLPQAMTDEHPLYQLLGPLNASAKRRRRAGLIHAECLFADPIEDLAVLMAPSFQEDEVLAPYEAFMHGRSALRLGVMPTVAPTAFPERRQLTVWVLTLDGHWNEGEGEQRGSRLIIRGPHIVGGMSGSPVLTSDGRAIGVINLGTIGAGHSGTATMLADCLPMWLFEIFKTPKG